MKTPLKYRRDSFLAAAMWLLLTVLAIALPLAVGLRVQTSFLALVPSFGQDPAVQEVLETFGNRAGRRLVFALQAESADRVTAAADRLYKQLEQTGQVQEILGQVRPDDLRATGQVLFPYRMLLVSDQDLVPLLDGDTALLEQRAWDILMSPISAGAGTLLVDDPLLLFYRYLRSLGQGGAQSGWQLQDQYLVRNWQESWWTVLVVVLQADVFGPATQTRVEQQILQWQNQAAAQGATVHAAGLVRHAAAASAAARSEIQTVGMVSLLGVVLLLLLAFRALRPLLAGTLAVATGIGWGLAAVTVVWQEVHILTLVFGASLVGIAVDYAFHYFAEWRIAEPQSWHPFVARNGIRRGLLAGLLTSLLGYAGLAVTPFPVLRQMALFAGAGLLGAFATVYWVFPHWFGRVYSGPRQVPGVLRVWLQCAGRVPVVLAGPVVLALVVLLALQLHYDDSIARLHAAPAALAAEQTVVNELMGRSNQSQVFVVLGRDAEEVLQREETLRQQVRQQSDAVLQSLSALVPSQLQQEQVFRAVQGNLVADGYLEDWLQEFGFGATAVQAGLAGWQHHQGFLQVETMLGLLPGRAQSFLWHGEVQGRVASLLIPDRPLAVEQATAQWGPGVFLVDRQAAMTQALQHYRQYALWGVALCYLLIALGLAVVYRPVGALQVLAVPAIATVVALTGTVCVGQPLTLFGVLGLVLVLGIGIDYTLFLRESPSIPGTMLAVTLSALTTILSFGLLALSTSPVIHDFGLVVMWGIAGAYVCASVQAAHLWNANGKKHAGN